MDIYLLARQYLAKQETNGVTVPYYSSCYDVERSMDAVYPGGWNAFEVLYYDRDTNRIQLYNAPF